MLRSRFFVVVWASCLWLVACQSFPTLTPPPTSPTLVASSSTPTAPSTPLATAPAPATTAGSSAWQVWGASSTSQGVFDVIFVDDVLWVGTSFSAVRLDPTTRAYTADETLGPVRHILPIEQGRAIAVGDLGVFFFDGQAWSRVTISSTYSFYPASVYALGIDDAGDLWLFAGVSRSAVAIHLPGHVPPRDQPWVAIMPAELGRRNSRTCTGWRAYSNSTFVYRTPDECQRVIVTVLAFEGRKRYGPVVVDAARTLWWLNGDRLQHLGPDGSVSSELPIPPGSRLVADPQGGVWAATTEGLFFATEANLQRVPIGLEKYTLYSPKNIAVDTTGIVWAATGRGLQRLNADNQTWSLVPDASLGGASNSPLLMSVAAAHEGGLWVTHGFDLLRYDGVNSMSMPDPGPTDGMSCNLVLQVDRAGDVWSAGYMCGMWQYRVATNEWQRHYANEYVDQVSVGADGSVIALTGNGQLLARAPNADWTTLASIDRSVDMIMVADGRGGAWVGSRSTGELWHYQAGSTQSLGKVVAANTSFNLMVDPQARLWMSLREGLMRYDGARWRQIPAPPIGLLIALAAAPDGRLWFTGERGVAVYDPVLDQQP